MFCPKCGTEITEGQFCKHCGESVAIETQQMNPATRKPINQEPKQEAIQQTIPVAEPTVHAYSETSKSSFPNTPPIMPQQNKDGSLAALVFGIISLVFSLLLAFVGIATGIVAVVMGSSAIKKGIKGSATAGLICGIIGLVLSVINSFIGIIIALI